MPVSDTISSATTLLKTKSEPISRGHQSQLEMQRSMWGNSAIRRWRKASEEMVSCYIVRHGVARLVDRMAVLKMTVLEIRCLMGGKNPQCSFHEILTSWGQLINILGAAVGKVGYMYPMVQTGPDFFSMLLVIGTWFSITWVRQALDLRDLVYSLPWIIICELEFHRSKVHRFWRGSGFRTCNMRRHQGPRPWLS